MAKATKTAQKKTLQGIVSKVSSDKTIKVRIETKKSHAKYGKVIKSHKDFLVHYEGEDLNIGDEVVIGEGKPVSKLKRWFYISKVSK